MPGSRSGRSKPGAPSRALPESARLGPSQTQGRFSLQFARRNAGARSDTTMDRVAPRLAPVYRAFTLGTGATLARQTVAGSLDSRWQARGGRASLGRTQLRSELWQLRFGLAI